jgi:outer membrane protein TolC
MRIASHLRIAARGTSIAASALLLAGVVAAQAPAPAGEVLPLRRAVTLAVQNSREVALARMQYNVSDKSAGLLRSNFRPNLYTGSGAAWTDGFPQTPGGQPTLFNLQYVQTVFNRPLTGQVRAAEERALASQLEVQRVEDEVRVETASAYLELAKVRHALRLLRTERESAQRITDLTRARVGEGLELPIEVTRAQLTAARIEQRIVQFEGREEYLAARLHQLMGMPAGQEFEVSSDQLPAAPASTGSPARRAATCPRWTWSAISAYTARPTISTSSTRASSAPASALACACASRFSAPPPPPRWPWRAPN